MKAKKVYPKKESKAFVPRINHNTGVANEIESKKLNPANFSKNLDMSMVNELSNFEKTLNFALRNETGRNGSNEFLKSI